MEVVSSLPEKLLMEAKVFARQISILPISIEKILISGMVACINIG